MKLMKKMVIALMLAMVAVSAISLLPVQCQLPVALVVKHLFPQSPPALGKILHT